MTKFINILSVFAMDLHKACRGPFYFVPSGEKIERFPVPDDKVPWSVEWLSYDPQTFSLKGLSKNSWADPELKSSHFIPKWNEDDGNVNRKSHVGEYLVKNGHPLNPMGRTGLQGRGRLGRWGPNHAADAIVTKWKRDKSKVITLNSESGLPILQFLAIQRRDTGEWALPGGMVDSGETADVAVKREFVEEALNIPRALEFFATEDGSKLKKFFDKGNVVYKGYVDDPRNTDNAWMETVAYHFHDNEDSSDSGIALMKIEAGDDAVKVQWVDVSSKIPLYASHSKILKLVVSAMKCDW